MSSLNSTDETPSRKFFSRRIIYLGLTSALVIIGQWLLNNNLISEGLLCYLLGVLSFEFLIIKPRLTETKFVIGKNQLS